MSPQFTVIIPVLPGEAEYPALVGDLAGAFCEVRPNHADESMRAAAFPDLILTGPGVPLAAADGFWAHRHNAVGYWPGRVSFVRARAGRAAQMNAAVRAARGSYLWFLHADTRIRPVALAALVHAIQKQPAALHYFDLRFDEAAGPIMRLNEAGVWVRSRIAGLPFGDQGFCIRRDLFCGLGGFDESVSYGEDHLLVWEAKRQGIPVCSTGAVVTTSARKYAGQGWLQTTMRHQFLTWKQAARAWLRSPRPDRGTCQNVQGRVVPRGSASSRPWENRGPGC